MGLTISQYLIKYKVYYILAWAIVSFVLMFISYDPTRPVLAQWIGYMVVTGAATPVCMYIMFVMIPRYLYQKRIGAFISYTLLLAVLNAILTYLVALTIYHF